MIKKIGMVLTAAALWLASCTDGGSPMTVTVTNPLPLPRQGEPVEIPMDEVADRLQLPDTAQIIVLDADGRQVPYQITYNNKLIFPVAVEAGGTVQYTIRQGTPDPFSTTAYGRCYPERLDDMAWENDVMGFRAYGPALQKRGERSFGYDIFTKRNTANPVLESFYADEVNPEKRARVDSLRKSDPEAAAELERAISYHVDHGYGMDCYAVGPTLGAGVSALVGEGDSLVYPYCYRTQEILDNGPLRFTVKLEFHPLVVRGDSGVVETRLISLDTGSYLNKTVLSYTNLKAPVNIATGIVLHEPDGRVSTDAAKGYIAYADPTTNRNGANGRIFVGALFPTAIKEAKSVLFSEKEKVYRAGSDGHVLAIGEYLPGSEYTYYWGAAWSKAAIGSMEEWETYLERYLRTLHTPLEVTWNCQ